MATSWFDPSIRFDVEYPDLFQRTDMELMAPAIRKNGIGEALALIMGGHRDAAYAVMLVSFRAQAQALGLLERTR